MKVLERSSRRARWVTTAGVALLAAACGGSPSSSNAGGATNSQSPVSQLVAFSHCMRSHGVSNFPDPNSSGVLPKRQLVHIVASGPRYAAAAQACGNLLPNGVPGSQPTQARTQKVLNALRNFSRCMRSHGVPNWPDPTLGADGRPAFNLPAGIVANADIDSNGQIPSPQLNSKIRGCEYELPEGDFLPPFGGS